MHTRTRNHSLFAFLGLALLINATIAFLGRRFATDPRLPFIAAGACVDMLVLVPVLYYWLVARRFASPLLATLPIVLLSATRATFIFPRLLPGRFLVLTGCEIGLLALILLRVRKGVRVASTQQDVLDRLEAVAGEILPLPALARALAQEIAVFYYALFSWRSKPQVPSDASAFSIHKDSGFVALLGVIAGASVLEIPVVHLLLRRVHPAAAWVATALGVYGTLWIVALARSVILRPVLLLSDGIEIRNGFLWRLHIPLDRVRSVQRLQGPAPSRRTAGYLRVALLADPQFMLELDAPCIASGPFGLSKPVTRVGLAVDGAAAFETALQTLRDSHV